MDAREIEKKAFDDFGKWADQWLKDHPEDEDVDMYTLSLMYPDGKIPREHETCVNDSAQPTS